MKKVLIGIAILVLGGAAYAYYLWNMPHENMEHAKADLSINAAQLFSEYNTDQTSADAKYLDKTIAVKGTVKEVNKEEGATKIVLDTGSDFSVVCTLDELSKHPRTDFSVGETLTFKGKCTGFNLDVQLERCVEVK
ncbi:MAG: OB-fold putative lipoprotein [Bacteroidetes bacterium]|nr:OB-fold putative lipoprotein [Bacteroidota bacterium]